MPYYKHLPYFVKVTTTRLSFLELYILVQLPLDALGYRRRADKIHSVRLSTRNKPTEHNLHRFSQNITLRNATKNFRSFSFFIWIEQLQRPLDVQMLTYVRFSEHLDRAPLHVYCDRTVVT
jgi:hypothetical protein